MTDQTDFEAAAQVLSNLPNCDVYVHHYTFQSHPDKLWGAVIEWKSAKGTKLEIKRGGATVFEALNNAFAEFQSVTQYGIPQRELAPQLEAPKGYAPVGPLDDEIPF